MHDRLETVLASINFDRHQESGFSQVIAGAGNRRPFQHIANLFDAAGIHGPA
jgi:hypothetical protein